MTDEPVHERRDATDLQTNDEVEQAVDEMLDADEAEATDAAENSAASGAIEGDSADDIDPESFDFESQEWTLGEEREPEVHEIRGMKFLFEEPDNDDAVLNELDAVADGDRGAQMRALVQLVVAKPEITTERWQEMPFAAKIGLAGQAAEFLGLSEGFLNE